MFALEHSRKRKTSTTVFDVLARPQGPTDRAKRLRDSGVEDSNFAANSCASGRVVGEGWTGEGVSLTTAGSKEAADNLDQSARSFFS